MKSDVVLGTIIFATIVTNVVALGVINNKLRKLISKKIENYAE